MTNSPTETVNKKSRGQVKIAVDIIGRRIANGTYSEGETLPVEQELASNLNVGRNALREAVKVLSGKGLILTAPRSGTKVRPRDEWNMLDPDVLHWHADPETATKAFMLDLIELRRIIEPKAAELAAVRASKEDIADILNAYERMTTASTIQERLESDIDFHTSVLKASHNSVLSNFKYAISTYLRAHVNLGEQQPDAVDKEDLERHYQLAWSIASGKAKSAYSQTVEILNLNRSHFNE